MVDRRSGMGFRGARRGFLGAWDGVARGGDAAFICIGLYRAESRFCGVLPGAWCLTEVGRRQGRPSTISRSAVARVGRRRFAAHARAASRSIYIECAARRFFLRESRESLLHAFANRDINHPRAAILRRRYRGTALWTFFLNFV